MTFDFEEWAQLAKQDEAAFEAKRTMALNQLIENCPGGESQHRKLKGLQFKVDMMRRRKNTPLASCVSIYGMLMEHLYRLRNLDKAAAVPHFNNMVDQNMEVGKIIPFKPLTK